MHEAFNVPETVMVQCKNCDELINSTVRVSVVVLALRKQMFLRHKAFSKSVAVQVQGISKSGIVFNEKVSVDWNLS